MIDPKMLTKDDIGRHVVYSRDFCNTEHGTLSSWNDKYVFVRFKGPTGEACEPNDVRFLYDHNQMKKPGQ